MEIQQLTPVELQAIEWIFKYVNMNWIGFYKADNIAWSHSSLEQLFLTFC